MVARSSDCGFHQRIRKVLDRFHRQPLSWWEQARERQCSGAHFIESSTRLAWSPQDLSASACSLRAAAVRGCVGREPHGERGGEHAGGERHLAGVQSDRGRPSAGVLGSRRCVQRLYAHPRGAERALPRRPGTAPHHRYRSEFAAVSVSGEGLPEVHSEAAAPFARAAGPHSGAGVEVRRLHALARRAELPWTRHSRAATSGNAGSILARHCSAQRRRHARRSVSSPRSTIDPTSGSTHWARRSAGIARRARRRLRRRVGGTFRREPRDEDPIREVVFVRPAERQVGDRVRGMHDVARDSDLEPGWSGARDGGERGSELAAVRCGRAGLSEAASGGRAQASDRGPASSEDEGPGCVLLVRAQARCVELPRSEPRQPVRIPRKHQATDLADRRVRVQGVQVTPSEARTAAEHRMTRP